MPQFTAPIFYLTSLLIYSPVIFSADLYRYQDSNGRWVFGDKKSLSGKNGSGEERSDFEKITIKDSLIKKVKPELIIEKTESSVQGGEFHWRLKNPLPVTIQHWLAIKGKDGFVTSVLAKKFEEMILEPEVFKLKRQDKVEHFYLLGEPIERPSLQLISPPFSTGKQFLVSQGFNGSFSHQGRGNRYAIDIAMPIGENILAVKGGVVADGQDNFSIGGAANYFLDKANHVTVMHDDGSYGIYAHILYGSMAVEIGERVTVGQVLARIGSTGYSTGPHLHFVLRYNSGRGAYSIPFEFQTKQGVRVPKQGEFYSGTL